MKKFDVIIVGGGPAGAGAAKILKDNNINFCIIDKNKFPREKLCGGGLTNKSTTLLNHLGFDYDKSKDTKEVELVAKKIDRNIPFVNKIVMVDRIDFDYNNLKQVTDNNLFQSENIVSIDNNILKTDKDEYEFKYIIFADGVNGYSRKLINNREFGFCVEYNSKKLTDKTVIDFCAIKNGYGWIFPKSKHTTIGLGNFMVNKDDYKELLINFAKKYDFDIDKSKIRGYFIPVFSKKIYKKSVIDDKYILVWDAASLVDATSGEGIYYALASGVVAAESIICALNNNQSLKKIYFKKSKYICKSLSKRRFLSKLLYSRCGLFFIKLGLSNKFFIKYINKVFG